MAISANEFEFIRDLVRQRSAIELTPGKEYLIESRLAPLVREVGLPTIGALVTRLQSDRWSGLHMRVVDAMTTNETSFFRDHQPFDAFRKHVLPELLSRRAAERELRIWSAACSSGQEPYSLAMLLREDFPVLASWRVSILATDLSAEMLERGRSGRFSQVEVNRGLPAPLLVKYFTRVASEWQIREDLRRLVEFRELNLAGAWPALPLMDCIFMRNVLIYFSVETKKAILARARQQLRPGGYLYLGAAETTLNLDDSFERVQVENTSCYRWQGLR